MLALEGVGRLRLELLADALQPRASVDDLSRADDVINGS